MSAFLQKKDTAARLKAKDKKRRAAFPTITIVCDYNDAHYGELEDELEKTMGPSPAPPPRLPPLARMGVTLNRKRGGAAPTGELFQEHFRPKTPAGYEQQYTVDGLLLHKHDFRTGPLEVKALRKTMLGLCKTAGVELLGLQPHVKARPRRTTAALDAFGQVHKGFDERNDPFYISLLHFVDGQLEYTEDTAHLLRANVPYRLVYDDTTRDLFLHVDVIEKHKLRDLFDALDVDRREKLLVQQVVDHYLTVDVKQHDKYVEMFGSDQLRIQAEMARARHFGDVMLELIGMSQAGGYLRFVDFLVLHAKAKAMLGTLGPHSARHRQPSAAFPFSEMTSLSPRSSASPKGFS